MRGCRTCCCRCAARSAEAAWRRSCCWRTGRPARLRPRCPAEAGRACSPAPSPCRGQGRRLRRLQGPRPALPLPLRRLLLRQRSSNLARGGRQAAAPSARPPRYPKAPPATSSAATAAVSSTACAAPRSTSCARCPASSRRRSYYVVGPTYDLRRRLRLARTGQHVQAHVLGCVLGQLRAEGLRGCEPCCSCAYEVRCRLSAVGRAAQTVRDGWRALTVACQGAGLGVSCQVVLDEAGSAVALVPPRQPHILVRGLGGSAEAVLGNCLQERVLQRPRVGVLAGLHEVVQVEVACDERGGLAVRLVQGQGLISLKVAHRLLEARALVEAVGPKRLHLFIGYCATSPAARSTPRRSARA